MENDPQSVVQAESTTQQPAPQPAQIYIQNPQRSSASRWFSWLGWFCFFSCIPIILGMAAQYADYFDTSGGLTESYHSLSEEATDKIAIIRAEGAIMSSDGYIAKQIKRAAEDDNVQAVVLRVDSPGGAVSASDNLYHQLNDLRREHEKPVVVSMGGMAASGGYYISMAVGDQKDAIFAEPTTTTGSIGVIIPHYNVSKLMERFDIVDDSIVSHPRKELFSATKPPTKEDRAILQNYVNESFERFKEIVKSGRPSFRDDPAALDKLATGEIFSGDQAVKNGLVDKIGFLSDAIERAAALAGLDVADVRAVEYDSPISMMNLFMGAKARQESAAASEQQQLLEALNALAVPRAYYMFTSCGALIPLQQSRQ